MALTRHTVSVEPFSLDTLRHPIVQAPMGGGPSTPALAAAVSGAGGLGFLAAADVTAYAATLHGEAQRSGVALGTPRWDDDSYGDKLELLCAQRVPVVSFTFGCPSPQDVQRLHRAGVAVWVTVTTPEEACVARSAGADAMIVQGVEAGGHRGGFDDGSSGDVGLLALLQLVRARIGDALPLVATGGIATGRGVAGALAAAPAHRDSLANSQALTALTRAFTGRTARGIVNRFLREHSADAPSAYPEVHHVTAPVRAAARRRGDADGFHLWAGQAYHLSEPVAAAELVRQLADQARGALNTAARLLDENSG